MTLCNHQEINYLFALIHHCVKEMSMSGLDSQKQTQQTPYTLLYYTLLRVLTTESCFAW